MMKHKQWTLKTIFEGCRDFQILGDKQAPIQSLVMDSRKVTEGALFFAIEGNQQDGNFFVEEAIMRGAVAIVSEKQLRTPPGVPVVQVSNVREALAHCARAWYEAPDSRMSLIGITGTNGKTTVSMLIQHLLRNPQHPVGLMGTVRYDIGQRVLPASQTMVDSLQLYSMLDQMLAARTQYVAIEVSSHGVDQRRAYGAQFTVGVFLNLTHDHLDYHASMEDYFQAKLGFFTGTLGHYPRKAVVNIDDPYGWRLLECLPKDVEVLTVGVDRPSDLRGEILKMDASGITLAIEYKKQSWTLQTPLMGAYNAHNVLAALGTMICLGKDLESAIHMVPSFKSVPGRLEPVTVGQDYTVLVDYAHTADALRNMLSAVKAITKERLFVVFGCGGNRDKHKRPKMMAAVQTYADHTWATADNPRKEPLEVIFEDMRQGVVHPQAVTFEYNRKAAIRAAIQHAKAGDVVVIAGRGHEAFQELESTSIPFDDRLIAKECLMERHGH